MSTIIGRIARRVTTISAGVFTVATVTAGGARADSPNIQPNASGVPGIGSFREIAGGVATAALIACGLALIISAIVWAVGSNSNNFQHTQKGKTGVLYSFVAAVLIGGVNVIIAFWNNIGTSLH